MLTHVSPRLHVDQSVGGPLACRMRRMPDFVSVWQQLIAAPTVVSARARRLTLEDESRGVNGNDFTWQNESDPVGSETRRRSQLMANYLYLVQGEMKAVVAILKTPSRSQWGGHIPTEDSDPLLRSFADLREVFNSITDLSDVSPQAFISPFLDVITAQKHNAMAVARALNALKRFLNTGIIPDDGIKIVRVSEDIAKAITQAKFFTNESHRDEGVLLASLGVMGALFTSPCGNFLTDESVCAILQCCFRVRFDANNGSLLHELAEDTLASIASVMFSRLPTFKQDFRHPYMRKLLKISLGKSAHKHHHRTHKPEPEPSSEAEPKSEESVSTAVDIESPENSEATSSTATQPITEETSLLSEPSEKEGNKQAGGEEAAPEADDVEIVAHPLSALDISDQSANDKDNDSASETSETPQETEHVDSSSDETVQKPQSPASEGPSSGSHIPYGLPSVREFLRFLAGLMDPSDQTNPEPFVLLGLRLFTTALEVGAEFIAQCDFLMKLIKDDLAYNLLKLLDSSKLRIFAAVNHAWFLMILVMRSALKFQIERYFAKIGAIISSDMTNVTNEQKEIALESLVQLFCIPHLITQLFFCYDLSYYCSDVFKDVVKVLHDNVFSASGFLEPRHILALDALNAIIDQFLQCAVVEHNSSDGNAYPDFLGCAPNERLKRKEHIRAASKAFNRKPKTGIEYLVNEKMFENDPPTPREVAHFLLSTPYLDKKQIGLYLCDRAHPQVLLEYVKLFKFENLRLDMALRNFLDTFRLPGEAQEIAKILQAFADYWYEANNRPFADADAAFTLAYAVIMLNTDQHNPQVRRNQIVMDAAAFKRNLSGTNGGQNFAEEMLDEIYVTIKENEIMIPTEHSGPIRDTYEWQILLRKGEEEENKFLDQLTDLDVYELFVASWGRVSSALFFVVDKSESLTVIGKALNCYRKCIMIAVRYGMSDVIDNLIIHLCKFASFIPGVEALNDKNDEAGTRQILNYKTVEYAVCCFGENRKSQLALSTMFDLINMNGDFLRESWRNVLDIVVQLYRAQLLPSVITHVEDFVDSKGFVSIQPFYNQKDVDNRNEGGLLSWLGFTSTEHPMKIAAEKENLRETALLFVNQCHPENLITNSKYFVLSSLNELLNHIMQDCRLIKDKSAVFAEDKKKNQLPVQHEEMIVFLTELTVSIVLENKDRIVRVWDKVKAHFDFLLTNFGRNSRIAQRAVVGLIRITNRNLFRIKDDSSNDVLQSLSLLFKLNPPGLFLFSRDIAFGIHDLLRANAANVHEAEHWRVIFTLLEAVGAAVYPDDVIDAHLVQIENRHTDSEHAHKPKFYQERGYVSDDAIQTRHNSLDHGSSSLSVGSVGTDWIHNHKSKVFERGTIVLVPNISRHDPTAFLKVTETLFFLVRDAVHVTPHNFESCVQCLRSMIEAALDGGKNAAGLFNEETTHGDDFDGESKPMAKMPDQHVVRYQQAANYLLDITYNLYLKVHDIYTIWAQSDSTITASVPFLWEHCWRPLLQAIARMCCDSREEIRKQALTTLVRAMLLPEYVDMAPEQWENCYADVLFPLLLKLLDNFAPTETVAVEETRVRAIQLVAKVLLNHLNKLAALPNFGNLFVRILDFMRRYWNCERSDLLKEAIPESLKNMILVIDNSGVFVSSPELYDRTVENLKSFLPELVDEIMQNLPVKHFRAAPVPVQAQPETPAAVQPPSEVGAISPLPISLPAITPQSPPLQHAAPLPTQTYATHQAHEQSPPVQSPPQPMATEASHAVPSAGEAQPGQPSQSPPTHYVAPTAASPTQAVVSSPASPPTLETQQQQQYPYVMQQGQMAYQAVHLQQVSDGSQPEGQQPLSTSPPNMEGVDNANYYAQTNNPQVPTPVYPANNPYYPTAHGYVQPVGGYQQQQGQYYPQSPDYAAQWAAYQAQMAQYAAATNQQQQHGAAVQHAYNPMFYEQQVVGYQTPDGGHSYVQSYGNPTASQPQSNASDSNA